MPVTAVRDEGALRMWVCRLPVHIDPAECTVLYGNLRRIRNFPAGRCGHRPLRTIRTRRLPLGSRGAGAERLRGFERRRFRSTLNPATHPLRLGFAKPPPLLARGAARGGVGTPANSYCPATLKCRAFLPQILNRSYSQICCTVTGGA